MILTGKAKKDFHEWFKLKFMFWNLYTMRGTSPVVRGFDCMEESMQFGVYVDFFDNSQIRLELTKVIVGWAVFINGECDFKDRFTSRAEARTAAIEKANEIYNQLTK